MNDIDHMLNGKLSNRHHQQMIQHVQRERFVQEVKAAQSNHKTVIPVRAMLISVINLLVK